MTVVRSEAEYSQLYTGEERLWIGRYTCFKYYFNNGKNVPKFGNSISGDVYNTIGVRWLYPGPFVGIQRCTQIRTYEIYPFDFDRVDIILFGELRPGSDGGFLR